MRTCNKTIFVSLLFFLSACRVGPHYSPPCVEVPDNWKEGVDSSESRQEICYWWEVFSDETLNALQAQALENSPTLYGAMQRVIEARALVTIAGAGRYPQATLNPSYTNTGELFKIYAPQALFPIINPSDSIFRIHQLQYLLPLMMSYELDLWGKIRGQFEAAFYDLQAEREAYHVATLTLTTDLANAYFQLQTLDSQMAILEEIVQLRSQFVELTKARVQKGIANELDLSSAFIAWANEESRFADAKRQRALTENMISTLMGTPAPLFSLAQLPLKGEPPVIPAGLPADVLMQRPDIGEAERRRASEHKRIGVAYASYFPDISLTGILGYSSPDLKDFLTWNSRLWSYGAEATQAVFDGGTISGNVEATWARFRQADAAYREQVLTAFKEVEDSLTNLEHLESQYKSLSFGEKEAVKQMNLSDQRYTNGLTTRIDYISTQQNALEARLSVNTIRGQRYLSTIQLIKALGGTW